MAAGPVGSGSDASRTAWVLNLLTDLAFNLLIFFVVCASSAEDEKGRPQQMPSASKEKANPDQKPTNIEVAMTRTNVTVNGEDTPVATVAKKLKELLASKARPEDRIVVVKSTKDTPYSHWIRVTGAVEQAGGQITLQLEEEREILK
jgi:biopolymer transport protein ExbD